MTTLMRAVGRLAEPLSTQQQLSFSPIAFYETKATHANQRLIGIGTGTSAESSARSRTHRSSANPPPALGMLGHIADHLRRRTPREKVPALIGNTARDRGGHGPALVGPGPSDHHAPAAAMPTPKLLKSSEHGGCFTAKTPLCNKRRFIVGRPGPSQTVVAVACKASASCCRADAVERFFRGCSLPQYVLGQSWVVVVHGTFGGRINSSRGAERRTAAPHVGMAGAHHFCDGVIRKPPPAQHHGLLTRGNWFRAAMASVSTVGSSASTAKAGKMSLSRSPRAASRSNDCEPPRTAR